MWFVGEVGCLWLVIWVGWILLIFLMMVLVWIFGNWFWYFFNNVLLFKLIVFVYCLINVWM